MKQLAIFLLLVASAHAQILQGMTLIGSSVASIPVALVNGKSNFAGSAALGTTLGTNGCASYTWCGSLPQPTLANGQLVQLVFEYTSGTAVTWTVKLGSQTMTAGPVTTAENGQLLAEYYLPNATSGVSTYTILNSNSTAGVTIHFATIDQWAGIATSGTLRTSCSTQASANNTITGCAITPTIGDLILMTACTPGTPARTSFTPGSGYTKAVSDIVSGCMEEWRTAVSGSSQSPTMTTAGTASVYTVVEEVFAANNTKGTTPSGEYVSYMTEVGTPASSASGASFSFEAPSVGNTQVMILTCGDYGVQSITDSNRSWKVLTPSTISGADVATSIAVATGSSADATGALSVTFLGFNAGVGDCNNYIADVVGADANPIGNRIQLLGNQASAGNLTFLTNWAPGVSAGLAFTSVSQVSNTSFGVTSPSGAIQECTSFGAQSLDGPSFPCENNFIGVYAFGSNATQTWTQTFLNTSTAAGGYVGEGVTIMASGGTKGIYSPASVSGNTVSGTGASTTMTPGSALTVASGQAVALFVTWNVATTTLTCTDNLNAGNWSVAHGPTTGTTGFTAQRAETLYRLNSAAGAMTITCHFSASLTATDDWMSAHVINGLVAGGTYDTASPAIKTTVSGAGPYLCNTSTTTASANEYMFSGFVIATAVQEPGNNITVQQEQSANAYGNASGDMVLSSTGTYQASWNSQPNSGSSFCAEEFFY